MPISRKAVIDIGTNTVHLLIAELEKNTHLQTLFKERHYTYLGENGLQVIGKEPVKRLFTALEKYELHNQNYQVTSVKVLATDALRSAENGVEIQNEIISRFGWYPEIISGNIEAELIAKGVEISLEATIPNYLIMDIGGGSVEFILISDKETIHLESLPIGISRLHHTFSFSDPPLKSEIQNIKAHISDNIGRVLMSCRQLDVPLTLVGSAGTFETFLTQELLTNHDIKTVAIEMSEIKSRYDQVTMLPLVQWDQFKWLPPARKNYILGALILLQTVIEKLGPEAVIVSKYSLKEGALFLDPE